MIIWASIRCSRLRQWDKLEASGFFGTPHHARLLWSLRIGNSYMPWLGQGIMLFIGLHMPLSRRREGVWGAISSIMRNAEEPALIRGNFNVILNPDERKGGSHCLSREYTNFRCWIEQQQLIDLSFLGSKCTWFRGKEASNRVYKRLDRICMSPTTRVRWPNASVLHLPRLSSDHNPLLLSFDGRWSSTTESVGPSGLRQCG